MNNQAKKIIVYAMVGIMQTGLFASVAQAAPGNGHGPRYEQKRHESRHDHDRRAAEREKQRRIKAENERHDREMKRKPFESKKKWRERQQKEMERHRKAMREIMRMGHR